MYPSRRPDMASQLTLFKRLLALPPTLRRSFWSSTTTSRSTAPEHDIYDVVCVGGGPAGLSFLAALQAHPSTRSLKTALVDTQDLTTARTAGHAEAYSNRCSSLTPSSLRFLKEIGAWEKVNAKRAQPYHAMEVWDGVSGSKIHFDPIDKQGGGILGALGEMAPGSRLRASRRKYESSEETTSVATMCENGNLTAALLQRLHDAMTASNAPSVNLLDKTKVESINLGPEPKTEQDPNLSQWPIVSTPSGSQLAARLLVGADGANSPVRQFANIASHGWDYGQHGVVATLSLSNSFEANDVRTAYQRFLPTGPIALLPLPGNTASLVWSTTPAYAARLKSLSPADFVATVNAAFRLLSVDINYMLETMPASGQANELEWRESSTRASSTGLPASFPRVTDVQQGSVASFPLRMRHADTYTGHRVALLGDAAHTIHPLAGQGLNLGLADAEALAKQIAWGVEHGVDIGTNWCLDQYNADRWAANNAMLGVVDKLKKVYSAESGPVVWGRSLGVDVLDRFGAVKGAVMGAASGGK
ncbi:ubiquinone biosynthesis hydrox [Hortaea werneckii]|nr:ubiquinone biosynthesis hydrox [Hortaea werneckii]